MPCPQCGEEFAIQVSTQGGSLDLIEDCAVCCRPMTVSIRCRPGEILSVCVEPA
ncbi:MAG: CPXCG motif-containing cysteine-rich protein [Terrimicrobiaceae bacterium]